MPQFSKDCEFQKVLAHRRDIDLVDAALELARDADPDLDFRPTQDWINRRAVEVARKATSCRSDQELLRCLISHLTEEHRLHGDSAGFDHPEYSYLPHVVTTGRGIPISLSVVYIEIGRRAGIELHGIPAPLHFLSCFQSVHGPMFVDAYAAGRVLSRSECIHWLQAHTGLTSDQVIATLRPASPKLILTRMLNNLKEIHCRRENWALAFRVQQRLVALTPTDQDAQFDLGRLALRTNSPGLAFDLFQRCLNQSPQTEPHQLQELLREARRRIALRN